VHDHHHHEPDQTVGGHGQLVVGRETVYLSHLPMFMAGTDHPHSFQVISEATFSKPGDDPTQRYLRDRQQHPEQRVYTFDPESFAMADLVPAEAGTPRRRSFQGNVFRGHFERGGDVLVGNLPTFALRQSGITTKDQGVTASIQRIVYFQEFHRDEPKLAHLEYVVFGRGQERFVAHVISQPPDFDQILELQALDGHELADDELARGPRLVFPGAPNDVEHPLREGERIRGELILADAPDGRRIPVEAMLGRELYLETGDLRAWSS
jgi:hypothetical protein